MISSLSCPSCYASRMPWMPKSATRPKVWASASMPCCALQQTPTCEAAFLLRPNLLRRRPRWLPKPSRLSVRLRPPKPNGGKLPVKSDYIAGSSAKRINRLEGYPNDQATLPARPWGVTLDWPLHALQALPRVIWSRPAAVAACPEKPAVRALVSPFFSQ